MNRAEVENRVAKFFQVTGFDITILNVFEGKGEDEEKWHKRFKSKRHIFKTLKGGKAREWFKLSKHDISTLVNDYA